MSVEDLEAALAAVSLAEAPDDWALAAYRLAVAESEAATRPADIEHALGLLDKAARILSADRAPVEHGRIVTAAANCHRAAGRADRALELFRLAAELLEPRASAAERAGALINVGLAHCETGQPEAAIAALDRALALMAATNSAEPERALRRPQHDEIDDPHHTTGGGTRSITAPAPDDEVTRLRGAALINRAQARQSVGASSDLEAAVDDYRGALAALPSASLQTGMAAHGLGAAVLELCRQGSLDRQPQEAVAAFEQALGVLSHASFPFHHAVARHSLALAYEMRGEPGDLARALNSVQASLSVFDPRLHASHWRTAHSTLSRLEAALDERHPGTGRRGHVARLLAEVTDDEREQLLRDRLQRAASLPPTAIRADLEALIGSAAALGLVDYRRVLRSVIGVLMELPDHLLETACATLCDIHRQHASAAVLDETLDAVINERLFGPQRVRVRDLLESHGWVRP